MSAGKGDKPRPVNKQKFDENFDAIFGPREPWLPKKKSIQIKGFKEGYARNKKQRLKKSHAFSMTFERVENAGWLKGAVDLNEVNSLEQKKSPRPKWKQQVYIDNCKENGFRFFDSKTKKVLPKQYHLKLFLEGNKIFVL